MDLTEHQQQVVRDWAAENVHVKAVRLFGSRARCEAGPDRDIDLALTVGPVDNLDTARGHYYALSKHWQRELTDLLEAKAHVAMFNDTQSPVPRSCEQCSVLLYRVEDIED
jgi:predicted nucleotidyltransferase